MSGNIVLMPRGQRDCRDKIIQSLRELADSMEHEDNYPEAFRCVVIVETPKSTASMYFGESASYSNLLGLLEMAKVRWVNELNNTG